jgi:hypothetical protein
MNKGKQMATKRSLLILTLFALSAVGAEHRISKKIATNTTTGDNVVTHIAAGGGWKTSITVVNLSVTKAATYTLKFYGEFGELLNFSFVDIGLASHITGALNPGGSVVIETAPSSVSRLGWGLFDYTTSQDISGFSVFTNQDGQEAVVPFESDSSQQCALAFDNTNGLGMGVAVVNSDGYTPINVTATFRDESGNVFDKELFTLAQLAHQSFILSKQWPATANRRGTVFFESDGYGLDVLGLRFNPQGAFTSVHSLETSNPL